jgi:metallo-beta-lactamase family protein
METSKNTPTLKFLGGAGTVTGSKTLVQLNGKRILVDCGLFQGLKELRKMNWMDFEINPASIDAVLLTHAHLDHCGYLPLLVKKGFSGSIHCTWPTLNLTEIILKDSAKIQEEDAERATSHRYSKHEKAEPLYEVKDVEACLPLFVGHDLNEWVILNEFMKFEFLNSGHILGGAFVNLLVEGKTILFCGDIGRKEPMLLYPPKHVKEADYIVLESTYGDRNHEKSTDVKAEFLEIVNETLKNKGTLMIPSFAVERTQELIYLIYQLKQEGKFPKIDVFLDSPMGINATKVFHQYHTWQKISSKEINEMYQEIVLINDILQSKALVADNKSKIVIAGSGMIEGGRILHYLNKHIENVNDTLMFVGFQGEGTRGRSIIEGDSEIKFFGQFRKVLCNIRSISSLSSHGDREEMMDWLRKFNTPPKIIFLNHGEPHQTEALRVKIQHELHWQVIVPKLLESFDLKE